MQECTESPHTRATAEGVAVAAEPVSAHPALSERAMQEMPRQADSSSSEAEYEAQKTEQDRMIESLANFKKFNPPIFSGEGSDR